MANILGIEFKAGTVLQCKTVVLLFEADGYHAFVVEESKKFPQCSTTFDKIEYPPYPEKGYDWRLVFDGQWKLEVTIGNGQTDEADLASLCDVFPLAKRVGLLCWQSEVEDLANEVEYTADEPTQELEDYGDEVPSPS